MDAARLFAGIWKMGGCFAKGCAACPEMDAARLFCEAGGNLDKGEEVLQKKCKRARGMFCVKRWNYLKRGECFADFFLIV
jgi:hypothetical protein